MTASESTNLRPFVPRKPSEPPKNLQPLGPPRTRTDPPRDPPDQIIEQDFDVKQGKQYKSAPPAKGKLSMQLEFRVTNPPARAESEFIGRLGLSATGSPAQPEADSEPGCRVPRRRTCRCSQA